MSMNRQSKPQVFMIASMSTMRARYRPTPMAISPASSQALATLTIGCMAPPLLISSGPIVAERVKETHLDLRQGRRFYPCALKSRCVAFMRRCHSCVPSDCCDGFVGIAQSVTEPWPEKSDRRFAGVDALLMQVLIAPFACAASNVAQALSCGRSQSANLLALNLKPSKMTCRSD